ncbi:MAG: hypothetical protein HYT96_02495 [Armatimonadetes bacterium]|nr:hypothetical protein [Armatimonadota bacterium]
MGYGSKIYARTCDDGNLAYRHFAFWTRFLHLLSGADGSLVATTITVDAR